MKNILNATIILVLFIFVSCSSNNSEKENYIYNEGFVHGTTYHIKYQSKIDFHKEIKLRTKEVDRALSMYDSMSVITNINNVDSLFITNKLFLKVFKTSQEVSQITDGAFDITVAPLVNLWGFGFEKSKEVNQEIVDSILNFVGYEKVYIHDSFIVKSDNRVTLDASAIAKGFSVDYVSDFFEENGIENYMVEIGGEVRAKGLSDKNKNWIIGIDKPIDDTLALHRELETAIILNNRAVATSGNYRKFYIKNGLKFSHTINPKTGYPVQHTLLSASVFCDNCMTADAYATSFMVLGLEESVRISNEIPGLDVVLIYTDKNGKYAVYISNNLKKDIFDLSK